MTNIHELFPPPSTPEVSEEAQTITLDDGEQLLARQIASLRMHLNRLSKVRNAKFSNRDDYDIELEGFGGELAYAKLMNLCPDLNVLPRRGGHDFVNVFEESVDVKTRPADKREPCG